MNFVERSRCPACACDRREILVELPFAESPLRDYLLSFYGRQGGVEFEYLDGASYVLDRCGKCGLLYQRHIPNDALMKRLYDKWIDPAITRARHRRKPLDIFVDFAEQVAMSVAMSGKLPGETRVLDFGMGWGDWIRMAKAMGCDAYGCDLADSRNENAASLGVKVLNVREIGDCRFDVINCEQVFEHLPEPAETLRVMARALSNGGLIRIGVPDAGPVERLTDSLKHAGARWDEIALKPIAPLEHINGFTRRSIAAMAGRAGMELFRPPLRKMLGYRMTRVWMRNPGLLLRTLMRAAGIGHDPNTFFLRQAGNREM